MKPGDHGSTFAGNPLVTRAAEVVVDIISGAHAGHSTACKLDSALLLSHLLMRWRQPLIDRLLMVAMPHKKHVSGLCSSLRAHSVMPLPDRTYWNA